VRAPEGFLSFSLLPVPALTPLCFLISRKKENTSRPQKKENITGRCFEEWNTQPMVYEDVSHPPLHQ